MASLAAATQLIGGAVSGSYQAGGTFWGPAYVAASYQPNFKTPAQNTKELYPENTGLTGSFLAQQAAVLALSNPSSGSSSALGGPEGIITYHVQPGETLSGIAEKFNISLNTIIWANKDVSKSSILQVGQELTILPVSGVVHRVKSGETLGGIALTYEVALSKIAEFNNVSQEGFIVDGQVLIIPGGTPPPPAPIRYASVGVNSAAYFALPVRGGRLTQGLHAFNAVDIAKACGAFVYASAPGRIVSADAVGWNGGYGKFVKISHPNGAATLYAHLSQVLAAVGQRVGQGAIIGKMGTTGRSTGCHVHFEVRGALNPFAL